MDEKQRLQDLVAEPREDLHVEHKSWLDVRDDTAKAKIAKALIALANHGGGYLVIGINDDGSLATSRPADLSGYTSDAINNIVMAYAEPPFHCTVRLVAHPASGELFPVVSIPGGQKRPIRSRRAGPNGQEIQNNTYYVRRPGPRSEPPQSGTEWDDLINRCVRNRQSELLASIREILGGGGDVPPPDGGSGGGSAEAVVQIGSTLTANDGTPSGGSTDRSRELTNWIDSSEARWSLLVQGSPPGDPARFPLGSYTVAYCVEPRQRPLTIDELRNALTAADERFTGWPPWWVPTRDGLRPYVENGDIECRLGTGGDSRDPAHSDFWRASPRGLLFLKRGFQEDSIERVEPGQCIDLTLPVWRMAECLLHSAGFCRAIGRPEAAVRFRVRYEGLANRRLVALEGRRLLLDGHVSRANTYVAELSAPADSVQSNLPELVRELLGDFFRCFDFFSPPLSLYSEEIGRMLRREI